ncbi:MAG: hypothetical protein KIG96_07115 [Treponema sp.]|nr:hypothetical protein [Treponema sp.]MCI5666072.1 hypothetical protein [Spirochaetia bacterium]
MKNIKFVSFSAGAGFILSLTFGIFSKSGILKVFLTALVFALIFAVLGFGLTFVYEKFLSLDSSEIDSTKSTESKTVSSSVGNNVDIVIEDQELERSGSNNRFNVGENRSMLNTSDVVTSNNSSSVNSSIAEDSKSNFVPVRNLETLTNISGTEAVKPSAVANKSAEISESSSSKNDDLDVLPDFGNLGMPATPMSSFSSSANDSIDEFSDTESSSVYTSKRNDVDTDKFQNTELIAKAISTVLSDES